MHRYGHDPEGILWEGNDAARVCQGTAGTGAACGENRCIRDRCGGGLHQPDKEKTEEAVQSTAGGMHGHRSLDQYAA